LHYCVQFRCFNTWGHGRAYRFSYSRYNGLSIGEPRSAYPRNKWAAPRLWRYVILFLGRDPLYKKEFVLTELPSDAQGSTEGTSKMNKYIDKSGRISSKILNPQKEREKKVPPIQVLGGCSRIILATKGRFRVHLNCHDTQPPPNPREPLRVCQNNSIPTAYVAVDKL